MNRIEEFKKTKDGLASLPDIIRYGRNEGEQIADRDGAAPSLHS